MDFKDYKPDKSFSWYSIFRYPFNHHGVNQGWYNVKWGFQRMLRGYDDTAFWGLDHYITKIALPVLKQYKKTKIGIPLLDGYGHEPNQSQAEFKRMKKDWDIILGKMVRAFELLDGDDYWHKDPKKFEKNMAQIKEGLALFGKHYMALWD